MDALLYIFNDKSKELRKKFSSFLLSVKYTNSKLRGDLLIWNLWKHETDWLWILAVRYHKSWCTINIHREGVLLTVNTIKPAWTNEVTSLPSWFHVMEHLEMTPRLQNLAGSLRKKSGKSYSETSWSHFFLLLTLYIEIFINPWYIRYFLSDGMKIKRINTSSNQTHWSKLT